MKHRQVTTLGIPTASANHLYVDQLPPTVENVKKRPMLINSTKPIPSREQLEMFILSLTSLKQSYDYVCTW